jgi:hypothetical protein
MGAGVGVGHESGRADERKGTSGDEASATTARMLLAGGAIRVRTTNAPLFRS